MKEIFNRYKFAIGMLGSIAFAGLAFQYKKPQGSSVWTQDPKEKLSIFEKADSQKPYSNQLKESRYADSLAQEAFQNSSNKEAKAVTKSETPEPEMNDQEQSHKPSNGDEFDAKAEAARLLGANTKEPHSKKSEPATPHHEDTKDSLAGKSAFTKVSMRSEPNNEHSSMRKDPKPKPQKVTKKHFGTTPNPSLLVASRGDYEVSSVMSSGNLESVGNVNSSLTGGNLLKKGSEYIAVINDTIELTPGLKQNVIAHVFGRLSQNSGVQPFKMFATAEMSQNGQSVLINVNSCLDASPNTKSISCSGDIGGLDGKRGLSDKVYSPDMMSAIIRTAGLAASQWSLSKMTQSVTQNGVMLDQTQSNNLWQTLAGSWESLANETAKNIERQGNRVTLYGQKVVKVLITKDTELW